MNKLFSLIVFLVLFSCSEDCSECENQLKKCMLVQPLPVDLPKPEPTSFESDVFIRVEVTADDKYIVESEEYSYEELIVLIDAKISSDNSTNRQVKIAGDKMAHYGKVFDIIAYCKERELKPSLSFLE